MIRLGCLLLLALLASGCETVRFYGQAIGGQMEILHKSRPTQQVLADPAAPEKLRHQLTAVEEIRAFATHHLGLPGDESYGRYADLGREHVVWSLVASPEFSLEGKTWRYPFVGELKYRGYFREEDSRELAAQLQAEGYDVFVGGVDAYSTLGWFHDPVLNTFVDRPDIDLAELIFHELTHRKLFRRGETAFNEALATAVAEEGVRRWLRHHGRTADLRHYETRLDRRRQFYDHLDATRRELEALYASNLAVAEKRQRKAVALGRLQDEFRELRRRWGGHGLQGWLRGPLNNAHLVSVITYHHHIPAFEALLEASGGDLDQFFERAEQIELPEP